MEPEKPPRRQTSDKTPTTIDLTADRLPSQTEPGDAAAAQAASETAAAADGKAGTDTASDAKPSDTKPSDPKPVDPVAAEAASTVPASDPTKPADNSTKATAGRASDARKPAVAPKGDPLAGSSAGSQAAPVRAWDRPSDLPGSGKPAGPASAGTAGNAETTSKADKVGPAGMASSAAASSTGRTGATSPASVGTSNGSGAKGLAAGILGGLIVLIGAGALQYGGVLPSLSPESRQLSEEVEALRGQIAQVEQGLNGPASEISALKGTVDTLQAQLAALRQSDETLAGRVEAAERKAEAPASEVQLARAVAIAALKTAIDRGGPFQSELDAARAVDPDEAALGELSADASGGLPSRRELVDGFPAVADRMLSAVRTPAGTQGSFLGRLMGSAESLVRMRPVGDPKGNEPADIVARIENRLSSGDLQGAQAEWQGLPEAAKEAGKSFKDQLDQRLRVEEIVGRLMAGATAAKQG